MGGANVNLFDDHYRLLFEASPTPFLVLTPDFKIVAVSNSYLLATMTRRPDIIGRHLFEVFPDNPKDPTATGVQNLRNSLNRVLTTGQPHQMAIQKYDIRRPAEEGGRLRSGTGVRSTLQYPMTRARSPTSFTGLRMLPSPCERKRRCKKARDSFTC
jgi:PAS domain-containing protein